MYAAILKLLTGLATKTDGGKTYLAAAGLFGLALWQVSSGNYEPAIQSFLGGLAALGVRHAVSKAAEEGKAAVQEETAKVVTAVITGTEPEPEPAKK